jgi:hypothetical protein
MDEHSRDIDPSTLADGDRVEVLLLDSWWPASVRREEDGLLVVFVEGLHDEFVLSPGLKTPVRFRRRLDG